MLCVLCLQVCFVLVFDVGLLLRLLFCVLVLVFLSGYVCYWVTWLGCVGRVVVWVALRFAWCRLLVSCCLYGWLFALRVVVFGNVVGCWLCALIVGFRLGLFACLRLWPVVVGFW